MNAKPGGRGAVLAALSGGALGVLLGALIYGVLSPLLENSDGLLRESQGLLWNLVPLLAVLGAAAGGLLWHRHDRK